MSKVVAELVMTNRAGNTTVIQVQDDASFSDFFLWYRQAGVLARASNRNNATKSTMRLEEIPTFLDKHAYRPELKVAEIKVNYYDKAKYEELISCAPDQLPGGITTETRHWDPHGLYERSTQPARVTDEYRQRQARRAEMFGWHEIKAG